MSDDISQSVSQRGRGEEIAENRRIYEVSDELLRRSQLYEAQLRDGKEHVSRFEAEQRVAEQFAKENGLWVPMHEVFDLGVPGPSGNENDTYVSNDIVYKVNNLLNSGSIVKLLEKISWHNILFYDTNDNRTRRHPVNLLAGHLFIDSMSKTKKQNWNLDNWHNICNFANETRYGKTKRNKKQYS